MRHPRVRRPFVVESRGNSREGGSVAIPKRVPEAPHIRPSLTVQAAVPILDPWAQVSAPAEQTAPRRILPNIMLPVEPEPAEPEVEVALPEASRLPRVRRVKPPAPRSAKPAAETAAPLPVRLAPPQEPLPDAVPDAKGRPLNRPLLRLGRGGRSDLPAGQRWKARLPRACW